MATFTNQDGTALGPLTTAWSMPSDCSVHILNCPTCAEGFRGQTCAVDDDDDDDDDDGGETVVAQDYTGCWPPVTERAGTPRYPFVGWGFYSPGLECPAGYTAACTARHNMRPEWDIQFRLHEGETAVGCCPEDYQCTNRNGNTCILIASTELTESVTVQTGSCSGTAIGGIGDATFPDLITQAATTTTQDEDEESSAESTLATREITLLAPMFQLNYQESDIAASSTSSSETSTSPSDTASPGAPASEGAESDAETDDDSDSGLSGGSIGGIVGGILGGLLLIGCVVAFVLWRRRRARQTRRSSGDTGSSLTNLAGGQAPLQGYQASMPGHQVPLQDYHKPLPDHHKQGYYEGDAWKAVEMPAVAAVAAAPGSPRPPPPQPPSYQLQPAQLASPQPPVELPGEYAKATEVSAVAER